MPKILPLTAGWEDDFYRFTAEYLPDSDPQRMRKFYEAYPHAFLIMVDEGQVIGTAFGRDRSVQFPEDDSFELCGIAVRYDYKRKGYGRKLLGEFEKAAEKYGAKAISLGSAEGYAERFYISCGYTPVEYKVWENGSPCLKKTFSDMEEYRNYCREGEGFVVMRKEIGR
ncbi:MAG: GNAT family N-acetyltransferase [Ruminiclostridium sp.]